MANKTFSRETAPDLEDETAGEDMATQVAALQATVAALLKAQTAGGGLSEERLEKILNKVAETQAAAAERAANPSNRWHPEISVFSYPEGDRKRPRVLKCPMTWCGHPVGTDTSTAAEIELMNLATPGEYQFHRVDRSLDTLTVRGEYGGAGNITKLHFSYVVSKDRPEPRVDGDQTGIETMLRTAFRVKTPQEIELESLRAQVEAMQKGQAVPA